MSYTQLDFTGSLVTASAPVAVFAGVECMTINPPSCSGGGCCCDHLEDQMLPTSSYGTNFVAPHSTYRGGTEEDIWRILADHEGTLVTTSLPAPNDSIALEPGQHVEVSSHDSFVITSNEPVMVGQYLASQGCTSQVTGDPSFTTFPPVEQYRSSYTFLVPATFNLDSAVVVQRQGTTATIDGLLVPAEMPGCATYPAGDIEGATWEVVQCPVVDGAHRLEADQPVGLGVYGYGPAGSYAYIGGTNLERINIPE
jgi:hypothetical protein